MKPKNHCLGTTPQTEVAGVMDHLSGLIDNIAIKVSVVLYGTQKDIHDPQCVVNMRISLWFMAISDKNKTKEKRLVYRYISDCTIDADNVIHDKYGGVVQVANIDAVLGAISSAVDTVKLESRMRQQ